MTQHFSFGFALFVGISLYFLIIPVNRTDEHHKMKAKNLNFVGAFMLVVGLLLIILGLTYAADSWNSPKVYIPIPIGVVVVLSVFVFESGYIRPYQKANMQKLPINKVSQDWRTNLELLFPPEVVSISNFFPFLIGVFAFYCSFVCSIVSMVSFHEFVEHNSPILTAVKILPISCGTLVCCLAYRPKYSTFLGVRNYLVLSGLTCTGGIVWLSRFDHFSKHQYFKFEFISLFLVGFGSCSFFQVYMNVLLSETPLHLQGVVSAIFQTVGQIAICIASAVSTTIIGSHEGAITDIRSLQDRIRNSVYFGMAICAVGTIVLCFSRELNPQEEEAKDIDKQEIEGLSK